MKKILFSGAGPALVTPFKSDGSVDYDAYVRLVKRQVDGRADFLVALATSAEAPVLSAEEKLKLLALTRENAGGLPIIVGAGSNSIPGTISNMELLKDADAWLIVVPFYNKPTQEGMFLYYKAICEATDKPVIIYNVPGRTGANMLPETALRLAREVPGIAGTKEASGKFDQIKAIIDGAPKGFAVLSGDDDMTYDIIAAGGSECPPEARDRNGPHGSRRTPCRSKAYERASSGSLQRMLRRIQPYPGEGGARTTRALHQDYASATYSSNRQDRRNHL